MDCEACCSSGASGKGHTNTLLQLRLVFQTWALGHDQQSAGGMGVEVTSSRQSWRMVPCNLQVLDIFSPG